jgi:hypothetical protein
MPKSVEASLTVHVDAGAVERVEEGAGGRVADAVEADGDAEVERAVGGAVAVALDELQQAVGEGVVHRGPGAEPVGDRQDEPAPLGLGVHRGGGDELQRDEDGLAGGPPPRLHPAQGLLRCVVAAGG